MEKGDGVVVGRGKRCVVKDGVVKWVIVVCGRVMVGLVGGVEGRKGRRRGRKHGDLIRTRYGLVRPA